MRFGLRRQRSVAQSGEDCLLADRREGEGPGVEKVGSE
jgi:hypothetical protein